MNQDLSILHLVVNASFIVQLVMLLLLIGSITSWAAIFRKLRALKNIKTQNEEFERDFWSGTSLNDLYASAAQKDAGFYAFQRSLEAYRGSFKGSDSVIVLDRNDPFLQYLRSDR